MPDTLADNLQRLKGSRTAIGNAIIAKGGTVNDGDGFEDFPNDISTIPSGGSSTLIPKTITENGTYNPSDDSADGYSSVVANVPNTYVAGDEGKVVNNGALVAQTAMSGEITVNDTYDTTLYNSITVNVAEPTPAPKPGLVRFMDYDGTILHTYTANEFLALSAMPENPTHEGLTSQGWNWSFEDAVAYVTANKNLDVGQMYVTDDGKTRVYITLDNPDFLSPTIGLYLERSSTVDIDWGDGYQSQITTSTTSGKRIDTHTYATTGSYVITLDVTAGNVRIQGNTSTGSYLLTDNKSNTRESSDVIYANGITKIELGSTIDIGDGAFKALSNRQGITIPTTAAILVPQMFTECYSLEGIVIPKNQTFVISSNTATNIFQDCFNLKNVSLSKESSIPGGMFRQCSSLERIVLPLGSNRIGVGSSSYQGSSFETCYKLSDVTIPEGIEYISASTFKDCDLLEHIKFPSTLLKIEGSCFSACNLMGDIDIPASVIEIMNSAFYQCRNINSVKFNDGNNEIIIRGNAFAECSSLDSVKLPSNLTTIEASAFASCFSLTSFDIPNNVTSLGNEVLRNCSSLQSVKIGSGVTKIPNGFCRSCTGLTSIDIPSTVKTISDYAFYECKSMKTITLHPGLESITGTAVFTYMYSLESLIIPDTVVSIESSSLCNYDTSLTELILPESLTTFSPASMASRCYRLASLRLPKTVTTLSSAPSNMLSMTRLKDFEIPSYFTELGSSMFPGTISRLVIPSTVTTIQGNTFNGAYCLKQLRFISTTPPTCSSSSGFGLASGCDIYVPAYALPAYSTASRYPNPSNYNYIGYGTYESGETLPNETSDSTLGLTWYATLEDWTAETNPITEGTGGEVYARTVAL